MQRDESADLYNRLPAGVKLNVLSFLTNKEFVAALLVDKKNWALVQNEAKPHIWGRLKRQFDLSENTKDEPISLLVSLTRESRLLVAYLGAQDCLWQAGHHRGGLSKEEWRVKSHLIDADRVSLLVGLRALPFMKMLSAAEKMIQKYVRDFGCQDRRCMFKKMYIELITSSCQNLRMLDKLNASMCYTAPELIDQEMVAIQSMVSVLGRCGSDVSMRIFYNKLSISQREKFLKKYGKLLCSQAISYHQPKMLQQLVEWGADQSANNSTQQMQRQTLLKEKSESTYDNYKP